MNLKLFHETEIAKVTDFRSQSKNLVKFLVSNRDISVSRETINQIASVRPNITTPITTLFNTMVNTDYLNEFCVTLPDKDRLRGDSVPDLLTSPSMFVDFKTNPEADPVTPFNELNQKILLNLAPFIKINPNSRLPLISDTNEVHSMFVKGLLCRNYSISDMWMNNQLLTYIIETYATSISSLIGKVENLDLMERTNVAIILSYFMAQRFCRKNEDVTRPAILYSCRFLGQQADVKYVVDGLAEKFNRVLTVADLCSAIAGSGPARLSTYNSNKFYRTCTSLGFSNDHITTYLAVEYPPYWAYLVIHALSGSKIGGLMYQLKQNKLVNTGKVFTEGLLRCRPLFEDR